MEEVAAKLAMPGIAGATAPIVGGCSAVTGSGAPSNAASLEDDADVSTASRAYTDPKEVEKKRSYGWDLRERAYG